MLLFVLVFSSNSNVPPANSVSEELCLVGNKLPGVWGRDAASELILSSAHYSLGCLLIPGVPQLRREPRGRCHGALVPCKRFIAVPLSQAGGSATRSPLSLVQASHNNTNIFLSY